jgi:hypothetical protein
MPREHATQALGLHAHAAEALPGDPPVDRTGFSAQGMRVRGNPARGTPLALLAVQNPWFSCVVSRGEMGSYRKKSPSADMLNATAPTSRRRGIHPPCSSRLICRVSQSDHLGFEYFFGLRKIRADVSVLEPSFRRRTHDHRIIFRIELNQFYERPSLTLSLFGYREHDHHIPQDRGKVSKNPSQVIPGQCRRNTTFCSAHACSGIHGHVRTRPRDCNFRLTGA